MLFKKLLFPATRNGNNLILIHNTGDMPHGLR